MRLALLTTLFLLVFCCANSQPERWKEYYRVINRAELLHHSEDFSKADSLYKVAFDIVDKPFKEDYYLAAKNSVLNGDYTSTAWYLRQAAQKGLQIKRVRKDKAFRPFTKSDEMQRMVGHYRDDRTVFKESLHDSLNLVIARMVKRDQRIRGVFGLFVSDKKINAIDTRHFRQLLDICDKFGWPGISMVGEDTPKGKYNVTGNITLLLLHFKHEELIQLDSYMVAAMQNGEMYPYHYARSYDYKYFGRHYKQLYGTYTSKNNELIPIDSIEQVNDRRQSIGLEPIEDYIKKRNIIFNH